MFQRLTNLFFGNMSESQEIIVPEPASPEPDEEGWLLVNAIDGEQSSEASEVQLKIISSISNTEVSAASLVNESSSVEAEVPKVPIPRSSSRVSQRMVSQAGVLFKVTQMGRIQRAQARANRRTLGRNSIQRQNHTRQHLPQHYSRMHRVILHQPGRCNACH
ncbi:hypothetical protein DNTS_015896 [Danionella cerebrum]|uniref:Tumor protein p53-inducible nuclear protein 2 n=1 Tax=Danionella cerebrum TaxID=2873325 RepID=A0A553NM49_9TELE|nr:hypothetical protein DNTS_015896 [Danionella translucida]TRY66512.1 hypothetical protein DNTS_015896 [Danionella translucida]TRY66513.1 hypothetical protein DNTS_015896 [Danionella translucida]